MLRHRIKLRCCGNGLEMTQRLRILLVGQSGPYAPPVLRRLVEDSGPWELVGCVEGRRRNSPGPMHRSVSPRPGPLPASAHLSGLASACGVPVLQTRDINDAGAIQFMRDVGADVLLCAGFDRLFKPDVLDSVRWGGINIHPSQLPEWRGPAPLFWALYEGRKRIGVTVHGLSKGEDNGPIYGFEDFARPAMASGDRLYRCAVTTAYPVLRRTLVELSTGRLKGQEQEHSQATRAPRPSVEDARIEPGRWECEHLVDFICAATFFCLPWLELGAERFHVVGATRAEPGQRLPGEFVQTGGTLIVQCADGVAHLQLRG